MPRRIALCRVMRQGDNLFLLTGVELPVTSPDSFNQRVFLLFVKGF